MLVIIIRSIPNCFEVVVVVIIVFAIFVIVQFMWEKHLKEMRETTTNMIMAEKVVITSLPRVSLMRIDCNATTRAKTSKVYSCTLDLSIDMVDLCQLINGI